MSSAPSTTHVRVTDCTDPSGQTRRLIELNRPAKLNCLSLEMLDSLWLALQASSQDPVILTGTGRAFCTGLDLAELKRAGDSHAHRQRLTAIYRCLLTRPGATTAFARGYAVGGGAGLLACARQVIVADDFRLRCPGGELAPLAAVVAPVLDWRTGGQSPGGTGWLGCELDSTTFLPFEMAGELLSSFVERTKERSGNTL